MKSRTQFSARTAVQAAVAAMVLAASGNALADNETIAVTTPSTVFTDTTPFTGGFIDTKVLTGLANGTFTFNFGFFGFNTNLLGASFDGINVPLTTSGSFTSGTLTGTLVSTGLPILFSVAGTAGPGSAYTGILNVTPVPEPETYAMLLAGLGAMGFMLRRRSRN